MDSFTPPVTYSTYNWGVLDVLLLLQNRVIHHLLYVIGNMQYADSQRLAAITLEVSSQVLSQHIPISLSSIQSACCYTISFNV